MIAANAPNRQYKDSTFRMLFTIKKNAADLYYGLTGITAAENDIVMDEIGGLLTSQLNHDVSFRIGNKLIFLVEHQSTLNENMPVRLLIGIAELFNRYIRSIDEKAIYLKKLIKLPSPEFYVLYNGKYDAPQQQIMKLSDAFGENDKGNLELKATFINIKCEENAPLLQRSQVLREYSRLVYYVEKGREEGLTLKPAIKNAIEKCLKENILCEFLQQYRKEVEIVMTMEYNRDAENAACREEGREEGLKKGIEKGRKETAISNIRSLMETIGFTAEKAMDALKIPKEERPQYLAAIN